MVCIFLLVGISPAQTRKPATKELPPSAYKLLAVKVTGTKRYQPDDVIRAARLQLGETVHEDDVKDAVRLLGDSGAFRDVTYSFEFDPDGTRLDLQVQDAEPFVPVRFENLVWFSDVELLEKLRAQVPLFRGQLPVTGEMASDVSEALQALLIEKHVAGEVDYLRVAQSDGPVDAFAFSVSGPHITIRNVNFSGADATLLPLLEAAARKLQGIEYLRSSLRVQVEKSFLPIYREHGYLKAVFGDAAAKVTGDDAKEIPVDVIFPVDSGRQYKLSVIQLTGNRALTADALRPLIRLQVGQPANALQLEKDLETIKQLYATHGYMAATITAEPETDDAQSTVTYVLHIVEGDVYKMGDLEIQGLDSRTTARLQNEWTLRAGDTYDSSYSQRFVQQAYKEIGDWNVSVHESPNPEDKTVDVTVRFDPKS